MERPKILLVEDNILLRWWMMSGLEGAGFWVVAPHAVEEAQRVAAAYPFDVLVTDWRLEGEHNGFEMLAHVRRSCPEILSVLISAEADENLRERARKAGFDRVIHKPFPVAEIIGAVQSLAKRRGVEVS